MGPIYFQAHVIESVKLIEYWYNVLIVALWYSLFHQTVILTNAYVYRSEYGRWRFIMGCGLNCIWIASKLDLENKRHRDKMMLLFSQWVNDLFYSGVPIPKVLFFIYFFTVLNSSTVKVKTRSDNCFKVPPCLQSVLSPFTFLLITNVFMQTKHLLYDIVQRGFNVF